MIELLFYFGGDAILIRIEGSHVTFCNTIFGAVYSTIEGLRLDRAGVIKEFPDLKDSPDWREESINRFKAKIKSMSNEDEIANYIIEDLRKFGYHPKYKQKRGFRREDIK